jgi:hypothetical protein
LSVGSALPADTEALRYAGNSIARGDSWLGRERSFEGRLACR